VKFARQTGTDSEEFLDDERDFDGSNAARGGEEDVQVTVREDNRVAFLIALCA
jgi:hypothetical protein